MTNLNPYKGICIAAPVGVLVAVLINIIPWVQEKDLLDILGIAFLHTILGSIFGLIMGFIFGLPLHFLYARLGIKSIWLYLIGGIIGAGIFWLINSYPLTYINLKTLTLFISSGIFVSSLFWYLVVKSK